MEVCCQSPNYKNDYAHVIQQKQWDGWHKDMDSAYIEAVSNLRRDADFIEREFLKITTPATDKPATLRAENSQLLEALKAIAGIEAWINDNEMKAHFQKTVYGAIKAAELEFSARRIEKKVEPMSDEAYEAAISGVSDDHPGMD